MKHINRSWARRKRIWLSLALLAAMTLTGCQPRSTVQISAPDSPVFAPTPTPAVAVQTPPPEDFIAPAMPGSEPEEEESQPSYEEDSLISVLTREQARGQINIGFVVEEQAVLNPLECTQRDLISLNELVFESVITLDDQMNPVGQLSDRWTNEGNIYTFHMRQGVQFHNGEPLTAGDVVETWQRICAIGSASPWHDRVSVIEQMAAVDAETLQVKFVNSGYTSLYAMTFPVVQRYTVQYAMPMGTGPYWYIAYHVGEYLQLESNPLWWKKTARVGKVTGFRYGETADALEALLTGEIDTLATRSVQASLYKKLSDYHTMDYATSAYEMLVPNLTSGALTDLRIRQAVMYAIDRTAIASTVYGGTVQESEVPVVPGSYLYETQAARFDYSPERALQLLYDVGWTDTNGDGMLDTEVDGLLENFTLQLVTYDDNLTSARTDAAKLIASQLKKVGIDVVVTTVTKEKMLSSYLKKKDFDLALISINLPFLPELNSILYHTGTRNYSGYADSDMSKLLLSARSAGTAEELQSIYSEIQMKIVEDLPVLGLYYHLGTVISRWNIRPLHGIYEMNTWNGLELVEVD